LTSQAIHRLSTTLCDQDTEVRKMTTIALNLLFVSAGVFAILSIAASLHCYGATALCLHQALKVCPGERQLRFAITDLGTHVTQEAEILRPVFGTRTRAAARVRPAPVRLRAAA
jgi:hypothetical protein